MVVDQPLVVYAKSTDKEKLQTSEGMGDFYDKWKAKKEAMKLKNVTGEKISLGDYLRNGI